MNLAQKDTLFPNILSTIGNTPLVKLEKLFPKSGVNIYAKLEAFNPGGSIKDRTAVNILQEVIQQGKVKKGDTIIESSSGNMAIGLAQVCLYFGLKLIVVVDPNVNNQNVRILKTYGAKVDYVRRPALVGGYLTARLNRVQELLETVENSFWTNQYGNPRNPAAHENTMFEIASALDQKLDYLFVSTSTCGTLAGCAQYAKKTGLSTKIIGVDAVGSVIFGTPAAKRLIPGHGAGRPSQFLKKNMATDAVHVTDLDCVKGCHRLLNQEAILCGGSSGAVVQAFEKYLPNIPPGSNCALILCDRGERYLDTIYNDKWIEQNLLNPKNLKLLAA